MTARAQLNCCNSPRTPPPASLCSLPLVSSLYLSSTTTYLPSCSLSSMYMHTTPISSPSFTTFIYFFRNATSLYVTCLLFLLNRYIHLSLHSILYHVETKTESTRYKEGTFNPSPSSGKEGTYPSPTWSCRYIHFGYYSEILCKSPLVPWSQTILISRTDLLYRKQLVSLITRRTSPKRLFRLQRYTLHHNL